MAVSYKNLQQVEKTPFDRKNTLEACPIFHYPQERIKRYIFCDFPALYPETVFHKSVEAKDEFPWGKVASGFKTLKAIKLYLNDSTYLLPIVTQRLNSKILPSLRAKLPPSVQIFQSQ